jgi:hypothetical protein
MIQARANVGYDGATNVENVAYTFAVAFRRAARYRLIRSLTALRRLRRKPLSRLGGGSSFGTSTREIGPRFPAETPAGVCVPRFNIRSLAAVLRDSYQTGGTIYDP